MGNVPWNHRPIGGRGIGYYLVTLERDGKRIRVKIPAYSESDARTKAESKFRKDAIVSIVKWERKS